MDPREYELMYLVEDRHWWYRGMETITRSLLKNRIHPNRRIDILDAGCGTGAAMTTYLAEYGDVTGVDFHPRALDFCLKRNARRLARASVLDLPFAPASFDLVASFDVLYERGVSSELTALREFARVLTNAGRVLLRLPAYDWLRGAHDRRVHTSRRYTKRSVKSLLEGSGFIVEHLSYANMFLFPLAAIKRLGERIFPPRETASDLSLEAGILNPVFRFILASEAPLVSRIGLPFGLSVVAVGRKRQV
jgi:SAM-dependent methyltransferase